MSNFGVDRSNVVKLPGAAWGGSGPLDGIGQRAGKPREPSAKPDFHARDRLLFSWKYTGNITKPG